MGGNVFAMTESIKKENIPYTIDAYLSTIQGIMPGINTNGFLITGSTGKKDISGDIDFGIDRSIIDNVNLDESVIKQADLFFKRMRNINESNKDQKYKEAILRAKLTIIGSKLNDSDTEVNIDMKKIGISSMFSCFPQYDEKGKTDKFVQIDWMIGNKDLLEFAYYSADYSNRTDGTKGLHRTQLILSMFNVIGYTFSHTKGIQRFEELGYNDNMGYILGILSKYYENISYETLKDFDSVYNIAKNSKFFDDINNVFLSILDSTRADIPDEFKKTWLEYSAYAAINKVTYKGDVIKTNVSNEQLNLLKANITDKEYKTELKKLNERKAYTGKFLPVTSELYNVIN
jgi:hypothetical protein